MKLKELWKPGQSVSENAESVHRLEIVLSNREMLFSLVPVRHA